MIFINDQAYKEFKELLDEATAKDDVEKINDVSFIVEKSLNNQYGGFIIVSSEENNGNGVGLKPVVQPAEVGCGSCGTDCGSCCEGCK